MGFDFVTNGLFGFTSFEGVRHFEDIDFDYQIWWWTYTINVADLVVTNEYDPALEGYDFPIAIELCSEITSSLKLKDFGD